MEERRFMLCFVIFVRMHVFIYLETESLRAEDDLELLILLALPLKI